MNKNWTFYLSSRGAIVDQSNRIIFNKDDSKLDSPWLCPLSGMGIIEFSGKDAAAFLQGQMTCDVSQLSDSQSSLGAYCNPKGRVITTFRMIKVGTRYLWLLPSVLLSNVIKRLRLYVLRSDVVIKDLSNTWCPIGVSDAPGELAGRLSENIRFPQKSGEIFVSEKFFILKPSAISRRLLFLVVEDEGPVLWDHLAQNGYIESNSTRWAETEIQDGIPNLCLATSEQYTPQMLNLDLLDGISFKKGCYTGQEIVARTHYLGKLKRRMFLARCNDFSKYPPNTPIYEGDGSTAQSIGNLLGSCGKPNADEFAQVVLQIADAENSNLRIENREGEKIIILKLPYTF